MKGHNGWAQTQRLPYQPLPVKDYQFFYKVSLNDRGAINQQEQDAIRHSVSTLAGLGVMNHFAAC